MSQVISPEFTEIAISDLNDIIIEDEAPVDHLISEKQQRLLVHSLYSSLNREAPFLATAKCRGNWTWINALGRNI